MELQAWNEWMNLADSMSEERIDVEIAALSENEELAFVEKNLRLGYLYYKKDFIAMATKCFQSISAEIQLQKENANATFFEENESGIKIYRATIECHEVDPCGGVEDCCTSGSSCCCCLGGTVVPILAVGVVVYAIFGEEAATAVTDPMIDAWGNCLGGVCSCCEQQCENDSCCGNIASTCCLKWCCLVEGSYC